MGVKEAIVKIRHMPASELVILEMVEYNLRELAETCTLLMEAGRPVVLNWAEGVVFYHQPLPFNTKELMRERMKGRIYWASVIYSAMPEHQAILRVGAREIPVVATPNPVLKHVARWLGEQLKTR
ncbi:hypothetical protein AC482_04255 [miscellaneous Crenarchaeota group-15 archaeon DG-45]|uniref:Uncharacterized protein n=1 Tax=miscellaneous Crenarchaeota group-15 archaeon DG-45 TaxID=1685127 RepID=A0A0M0BP26_9ARCH|nr:MAG: hypothetical protein AC482_04255 [miscellaneous Crenarchaeota group-15 archaeon DG-45]